MMNATLFLLKKPKRFHDYPSLLIVARYDEAILFGLF